MIWFAVTGVAQTRKQANVTGTSLSLAILPGLAARAASRSALPTAGISLFGSRGRYYEGLVKRSRGFGDRGPVVLVMNGNSGGRTR